MSDTYGKMLECSADWEDTESIVQACADYCDNENKKLRAEVEMLRRKIEFHQDALALEGKE